MLHNAVESCPQSFPIDVAQFFKSLSDLTMKAKYQGQDDYINHLLDRIATQRKEMQIKEMQIKSAGCAQMSAAKKPAALEFDGLAELAKLYAMVADMLHELEKTVMERWSLTSKKSLNSLFFNGRMSALEDLQAEYDDVMEVKRKGVEAVAKKARSDTWPRKENSHSEWQDVHDEGLATDTKFFGRYVPKEDA